MRGLTLRPIPWLAAAVALTTLACSDAAPELGAIFQAAVVSPNGDDGAALIELVGPLRGVEAPTEVELLTTTSGDTTWVFLALETPGRITFTLTGSPGSATPDARILQIADGKNDLRLLDGYSVELNR